MNETEMLIEWLQRNTNEMFLAQAGRDSREAQLQGLNAQIPMDAREKLVTSDQRFHVDHDAQDMNSFSSQPSNQMLFI